MKKLTISEKKFQKATPEELGNITVDSLNEQFPSLKVVGEKSNQYVYADDLKEMMRYADAQAKYACKPNNYFSQKIKERKKGKLHHVSFLDTYVSF